MTDHCKFRLALRLLLEHKIYQAVSCVERRVHAVSIVRDWLQVERLDADALLLRVLLARPQRQLVALDLLEERGHHGGAGSAQRIVSEASIRCWSARLAKFAATDSCEIAAVNATSRAAPAAGAELN